MPVDALSRGQPRPASLFGRAARQATSGLRYTGIVAITGIDGYASLRVAALGARCDLTPPALHTFKDGTTRSTQVRIRREPNPDTHSTVR